MHKNNQEAAFVLTQPKEKQSMDAEQIRQKFTKVLWPQAESAPAEVGLTLEPPKAEQ